MKKFLSTILAIACLMSSTISVGAVTFGNSKDYYAIDDFYNGYALVYDDGLFGYIDETGAEIAAPIYENAWPFDGDLAPVMMDGLLGCIDTTGALVTPCIYEDMSYFSEGIAGVMLDGKCGAIDSTGQLVVPCIYDSMGAYTEGLLIVSLDGSYGYVDGEGNVVIPLIYDALDNFSEGMGRVLLNGMVGFIDNTGEVVVPIIYEDASAFHNGYALVVLDGKYGFVDETGTVVVDFLDTNDEAIAAFIEYTSSIPTEETTTDEEITPVVSTSGTATPTASTVLVDGTEISFEAYHIADNNYFKLRDIAAILNGTEASFEVTWNEDAGAIEMLSGQSYTQVGGELTPSDGNSKTYTPSTATIYLDGQEITLTAHTINDNNYFKLRDLGEALGFNVSWDGDANSIVVASNEAYTTD